MSSTSKANELARMVQQGRLAVTEAPQPVAAEQLLHDAVAHARTIDSAIEAADPAGAVLLAYECCRKVCLGLLLAGGYRPAGGAGEHATTFEGAEQLLSGRAAAACKDASFLRRERNSNMYQSRPATPADAHNARELASTFLASAELALRAAIERVRDI